MGQTIISKVLKPFLTYILIQDNNTIKTEDRNEIRQSRTRSSTGHIFESAAALREKSLVPHYAY